MTLEQPLLDVETCLGQLGEALRSRDGEAVERHADALQRALAEAVASFSAAARSEAGVPPALRHRLILAGGHVAAQRESLARATAALDRAMDVLMPGAHTGFYSSLGKNERRGGLGAASFQA